MKIIKKIKRFLGLELPYLLEDEELKEPIVFKNWKNVVKTPKNTEVKIYKNDELENQLTHFSNCIINSGISMNEARKLLNLRKK